MLATLGEVETHLRRPLWFVSFCSEEPLVSPKGSLQQVVVKTLFSRLEDQKRETKALMGYRYLGRLCLTDHWEQPHPVAIYICDPARHGLGPEGQLHEAVLINQESMWERRINKEKAATSIREFWSVLNIWSNRIHEWHAGFTREQEMH